MGKYYGAIQGRYGHDYVFLYTEEQIKREFEEYGIDKYCDLPEENKDVCEDIHWPMGGSNSSATSIYCLNGDEEAKEFLTQNCWGPDLEDPMAVDIAEYGWSIDTDEGCAQELLDRFGLKAKDYEQCDERAAEICSVLGVGFKDLYRNDIRELRYSDIVA